MRLVTVVEEGTGHEYEPDYGDPSRAGCKAETLIGIFPHVIPFFNGRVLLDISWKLLVSVL